MVESFCGAALGDRRRKRTQRGGRRAVGGGTITENQPSGKFAAAAAATAAVPVCAWGEVAAKCARVRVWRGAWRWNYLALVRVVEKIDQAHLVESA